MRIVEFSLRRRVTVAMCAIAVVIFGLVAFMRLPVNLLPDLSYPTLTVETKLPGAAPAEIEQLVTRPIEEVVGVVSGVQRLSSVSRPGVSQVTLEFGWGREMDFAGIDVREKLDLLRLPDGTERPVLLRYDPAAAPVIRLFVTGDDDLFRLRTIATEDVETDLESTAGVAAIKVHGGYEAEIEVRIDQGKLAALGIELPEVEDKLARANVNQAGGSLYEREARYLVRSRNELLSLDDIRAVVVRGEGGNLVRLGDVATVRRTHQARETITRLGGEEAVELAIFKEGDANTTAVADALQARLEQVRKRLPKGVEVVVATDQSTFIRASIREVLTSAAWGGLFAVMVLLLFLRDGRATAIIATAIPLSIVATFFLMYQTDTSLNVMSLGGLALGVGMLVDNAIVVLEAIFKHRERGVDPVEAAATGAAEVGRAVIASTLTTVAVFLPVVFLEGIAAQLFRDMAVTVCFSLVMSLVVSLTVIPTMSVVLGRTPVVDASGAGRMTRAVGWPLRWVRVFARGMGRAVALALAPLGFVFDRGYVRLQRLYPAALRGSLRRPLVVLGIAALAFTASVASLPRLGFDLLPAMAQGEFDFVVELREGTPLAKTDRVVSEAVAFASDDPRVARVSSVAGRAAEAAAVIGTEGESVARVQVRMAPDTTVADEADIVALMRSKLAGIGATRVRFERPSMFSLRRPVEVEVYGEDLGALRDAAGLLGAQISQVPGVVEARSSAEFGSPEIQVRFDRERLVNLGLDLADVSARVRTSLQGNVTTQMPQGARDTDIRVRAVDPDAATVDDIRELVVAQREGVPIVLSAVADVTIGDGPGEIQRLGQNRAAVVTADVQGRDMGSVAEGIRAVLTKTTLPSGVTARLAGQDEEMQRSLGSLGLAMGLAAFFVYLVMASQFESLRQPLVVIFTLPLAAIGVVWALLATSTAVSVVSMIGMVMLAGIVVNNAIVLVDAINRRRGDHGLVAAIVGAGRDRLRPILMTSATTVLGLLPMALGLGAGAELRQALAIAVIGGLLVATVLTLLVIPVVYAAADPAHAEVDG